MTGCAGQNPGRRTFCAERMHYVTAADSHVTVAVLIVLEDSGKVVVGGGVARRINHRLVVLVSFAVPCQGVELLEDQRSIHAQLAARPRPGELEERGRFHVDLDHVIELIIEEKEHLDAADRLVVGEREFELDVEVPES